MTDESIKLREKVFKKKKKTNELWIQRKTWNDLNLEGLLDEEKTSTKEFQVSL